MNYSKVANELCLLEHQDSRKAITKSLSEIFVELDGVECKQLSYLLLGALGPAFANKNFNMAEKTVYSSLIVFFAARDETLKMAFEQEFKKSGDLGSAFEKTNDLIKNSSNILSDLSVGDIYSYLDLLADVSGVGAVLEKQQKINSFLQKMSGQEGKILLRILTGKMRLGFSTSTILDALSMLCQDQKAWKKILDNAYNLCGDIGLIALFVKNKMWEKLKQFKPILGYPVVPAAAERLDKLEDLFEDELDIYLQPKLDGLRLQIHKKSENGQTEIKLFSRNLLDVSPMFPDVVQALQQMSPTNFIAEGEVIGVDEQGEFLAFQETAKRKRKYDVSQAAEKIPVQFFFFDLLFFANESMIEATHVQRRAILESHFNPSVLPKNFFVVAEQKISANSHDHADLELASLEVETAFHVSIEDGFEGLIAKKGFGKYQAGKRGKNWIKIKQLEKSRLGDTLDLVILGYYPGKGRRADFGIGAILVGAWNDATKTYQTMAKVGSGLTDESCKVLGQRLEELKVQNKPEFYDVNSALMPVQWVMPKIVVEVEADEISASEVHSYQKEISGKGQGLRFPRLKKIRWDKELE